MDYKTKDQLNLFKHQGLNVHNYRPLIGAKLNIIVTIAALN